MPDFDDYVYVMPHTYISPEKHVSLCARKPTICLGENKDADQLRGNREADQRLCFRYTDSTFPPLLIPKFSRFWVSSVTVQAGLCWTWSETQIVGFVMHRLMSMKCIHHQTPLLYRKAGVCRGIPNFLIFDTERRLWVLVKTASANVLEQKY